MRRILIDTNVYSRLMSGDTGITGTLNRYETVLISPVVIGELLDGFRGGNRDRENRAALERFCAKPRSLKISITDQTAEWFAVIKQNLKTAGKPIPLNDVWIAASAMEQGAVLFTFDTHFAAIQGLLHTG